MKVCTECEKRFGLLEKIYTTDTGEMYCSVCVKTIKEKPKEESHYVELKDSVPEPITLPESSGWEFRVIKLASGEGQATIERFESTINSMGSDGWELVSVIPLNILLMKTGKEEPAMIFKRKK